MKVKHEDFVFLPILKQMWKMKVKRKDFRFYKCSKKSGRLR